MANASLGHLISSRPELSIWNAARSGILAALRRPAGTCVPGADRAGSPRRKVTAGSRNDGPNSAITEARTPRGFGIRL